MIDISKIKLNQEQVLGGNYALVSKITPAKKFVENKPTDIIEGYKIEVVTVANKTYDKLVVKVIEKPELTQEDLDAMETPVRVTFINFEGKIYKNFKANTYEVSCKAKSVQFAGTKK